ncbi:hypothetical protein AAFM79_01690 [Trichormus azollae HNT15244]
MANTKIERKQVSNYDTFKTLAVDHPSLSNSNNYHLPTYSRRNTNLRLGIKLDLGCIYSDICGLALVARTLD